jgi:lysosomal Pro-X carboxypeptidase
MAWQEKSPILGFPDRSGNVSIPRVLSRFAGLLLVAGAAASLFAFDGRDALGATTQATVQATAKPAFELNDDGSPNVLKLCQEKWFTQTLDHFDVGAPTYEQRYFVCDEFYREDDGVMFFYVGNEADVELYLNHTGLMWENAAEFGAMLVFAEHRYFGKSLPFGKDQVTKHMKYLSTEQTMADYAVLITYLKEQYKRDIPVIGFGGSYGGMLGSWFRMKYPHIIDGVIAASAPILSYFGDEVPHDLGGYSIVTTFDASPAGGSAPNCVPNVRRAWPTMRKWGKTADGRQKLKQALSLCEDTPLESPEDVEGLLAWGRDAFDSMAMGNYPYPSSYIMSGQSELPAYPMRVACSHVAGEFPENEQGEWELLQAFSHTLGVYYNSTKDATCFQLAEPSEESAVDDDFWQYLYCAELYGPTTTDGVRDMFWDAPWDFAADNASCHAMWGIDARIKWPTIHYGGRKFLEVASNMVFSNGNYDPCSATGVLQSFSESVVAVHIEGGAHHLDLMFSNPLDPAALTEAREIEKTHMRKWAKQFYIHKAELERASAL